jgi:hypothetical protein
LFGWFRKRRPLNLVKDRPGPADQLAYYRTHPPRCIAGFRAQPVRMPGVVFDGHASVSDSNACVAGVRIEGSSHVNPIFWLYCTCGCDSHFVLGYYWRNPDYHNELVFVGPLALRCGTCGKVTELFDSAVHGYDAETGGMSASYRGEGERAQFVCHRCGPRQVQVFARFEYPDDLFEPSSKEFRGREQDLFSWFSLVGKCEQCGRLMEVADCECA